MERFVVRCYHSLAMQRDADDVEFIFVNDGSSDNTLSILREIKTKDKRVVIIDQNNAGVSVARNSALAIAKGEYVKRSTLKPDAFFGIVNTAVLIQAGVNSAVFIINRIFKPKGQNVVN